jgi:undecaprenyl diphosphate synthase
MADAAIPKHVAIIPDGNRRWARERGLEPMEGHRLAYERSFELAERLVRPGVKYLTVYAFSTENWTRAKDEVGFLLRLLERFVSGEFDRLSARGYRIRFVGSREGLGKKLARSMEEVEAKTAGNQRITLSICFNYGGRRDLVEAVRAIMREGVPAEEVDEATIETHLSTHGTPPPDLILRTSGEQRLSNFLLFEGAYAELMFFDVYWPDFGEREIDEALAEYARRARRYGS